MTKIVAALRGVKEDRATCKGKFYGSKPDEGFDPEGSRDPGGEPKAGDE